MRRMIYASALIIFVVIGYGDPASALAPSPQPDDQPISAADNFFSIFCPILFLVVLVVGGILVARRRSAREERRRAATGVGLPLPERGEPGKRPRGLPVGPLQEFQQDHLAALNEPLVDLPEPEDLRELPKPSLNGHRPDGQIPPEDDPRRRFKRGY